MPLTLPLQRHFMYCELERRLYRCRTQLPSALEEFDAACEQHHQEMDTIRKALIDRFGGLPFLATYRQAAIRCQKDGRWEAARSWAQRGIGLYGEQSLRPEALDDLHRRVAYASAKLATRPRQRQRSVITSSANGLPTEMLTCAACGQPFERVIVRGRKPRRCPRCSARESQATE